MFKYETRVRLFDTDAAGLLFFGNQFRIVHDTYEAFMELHGLGMGKIIRGTDWLLPIVHAEADYTDAVFIGDRLTIELVAEKISTHSFTLGFNLVNRHGKSVGSAKTVHVSVDKATRKKIPLPEKLEAVIREISS